MGSATNSSTSVTQNKAMAAVSNEEGSLKRQQSQDQTTPSKKMLKSSSAAKHSTSVVRNKPKSSWNSVSGRSTKDVALQTQASGVTVKHENMKELAALERDFQRTYNECRLKGVPDQQMIPLSIRIPQLTVGDVIKYAESTGCEIRIS